MGEQDKKQEMTLEDLRKILVGGRLAEAIMRAGLTRAEIARQTNISEAALSRYVKGERLVSSQAAMILCPLLKVSSDWLLAIDEKTQAQLERLLKRYKNTDM